MKQILVKNSKFWLLHNYFCHFQWILFVNSNNSKQIEANFRKIIFTIVSKQKDLNSYKCILALFDWVWTGTKQQVWRRHDQNTTTFLVIANWNNLQRSLKMNSKFLSVQNVKNTSFLVPEPLSFNVYMAKKSLTESMSLIV